MLTFKHIPYQIKLNDGARRIQLSDRFLNAVEASTLKSDNVIILRKWEDLGMRFGTLEDVEREITEEIDALYDESRLKALIDDAQNKTSPPPKKYQKYTLDTFKNAKDWKTRLNMLHHFASPSKDDYPLLSYALNDDKLQVRRAAVSLLTMIEDIETLQYLKVATKDRAIPVRRTAADGYSDLGFKEGLDDIYPLLNDKSPIVRWRAAMFIYEVGDEDSLKHLYPHKDDPEYSVRLQVQMGITRIEKGEAALGSVWKLIQERNH